MLDTIKLKSPAINFSLANQLEEICFKRQGINIKTGELVYEITTGSLTGSFDNNISIRVLHETEQNYYIIVEGSVHKALLGHNVYGGPKDFCKACKFFIALIEKLISVPLPCYSSWSVLRIDVAEVYKLPSFASVQEWFRGINASSYPRRSVHRYGLSGIYVKGSTTTLKFYHKGVEFKKHDYPKLRKLPALFPPEKLFDLQSLADCLIRCELEIKVRKLKYDFGFVPSVADLNNDYIDKLHDLEVERFLKEGEKMKLIVSNANSVKDRLFSLHTSALAGTLLGTWYQLTTLGEDVVKSSMSKSTYYRHIKYLKDAGVTWNCTDVILANKHSLIPAGFAPIRNNSTRLNDVSSNVLDTYNSFNIA